MQRWGNARELTADLFDRPFAVAGQACFALRSDFVTSCAYRRTARGLKLSLNCHPRACPEDPGTVAVDPWDKPEGDKAGIRYRSLPGVLALPIAAPG